MLFHLGRPTFSLSKPYIKTAYSSVASIGCNSLVPYVAYILFGVVFRDIFVVNNPVYLIYLRNPKTYNYKIWRDECENITGANKISVS